MFCHYAGMRVDEHFPKNSIAVSVSLGRHAKSDDGGASDQNGLPRQRFERRGIFVQLLRQRIRGNRWMLQRRRTMEAAVGIDGEASRRKGIREVY